MRQVFIGGCDRSGTTLLGAMLGAAEGAVTTPESQFKKGLLVNFDWPESVNLAHIEAAFRHVQQAERFRVWDLHVDQADYLAAHPEYSYRNLLQWIVQEYGKQKLDKTRVDTWIDHDPQNFQIHNQLKQHFPDAKFIHIVRDGRAIAASVMPLDWGPNTVLKAAQFWQKNVALGLAAEKALAEDVVQVRYEDLVSEPEATLRRLCGFAGLTFNMDMLTSSGFAVPGITENQHRLVGKAVDDSRVNAWRKQLTQRQIEQFEAEAMPLMKQLGYKPLSLPEKPANAFERLIQGVNELVLKQVRRKRHKQRYARVLAEIEAKQGS